MVAARHQPVQVVQHLIVTFKPEINFLSELHGTPLILAVEAKNVEVVKCLVEAGADVNQIDKLRNTPLFHAVFLGNQTIVEYLLSKGANALFRGENNMTVMHVCAEREFSQIAKMILAQDPKNKELVFIQTDVEEDDDETGMSPMHVAAEWNSTEMVELLWEVGGERLVNLKNAGGHNAIEFAYNENQEEVYEFLCRKMGI